MAYFTLFIKGRLAVIVGLVAAEVLKIRTLLNHLRHFNVGKAIFRLNNAGAQSQPQGLGHVALLIGEQRRIAFLDGSPRDGHGLLRPPIVLMQLHSYRLTKFVDVDLPIVKFVHPASALCKLFSPQ